MDTVSNNFINQRRAYSVLERGPAGLVGAHEEQLRMDVKGRGASQERKAGEELNAEVQAVAGRAIVNPITSRIYLKIANFVNYDFLFKNVSNKEAAIGRIYETAAHPQFNEKLDALMSKLEADTVNWDGFDFKDEEICNLFVLAHLQKRIKRHQLATFFIKRAGVSRYLCDEARAAFKGEKGPLYEHVPLFIEGKVNPVARELVRRTMQPVSATEPPSMTDEELDAMFEEMRNYPPSEQSLLIGRVYGNSFNNHLKNPQLYSAEVLAKYAARRMKGPPLDQVGIMDDVHSGARSNIFYRVENNGLMKEFPENAALRMCPSMGMVDAFIKIRGGEKIRIFGFGAGESAWEGDKRIVSMPSPYEDLPDRADTFKALFEDFSLHDALYHVILVSTIPKELRQLFFAYRDELKTNLKSLGVQSTQVTAFFQRIEDMEARFDELGKSRMQEIIPLPFTPENFFWSSIRDFLDQTGTRIVLAEIEKAAQKLTLKELEQRACKVMGPQKLFTPTFIEANRAALQSIFIDNPEKAMKAGVTLAGLYNVGREVILHNYRMIGQIASEPINVLYEDVAQGLLKEKPIEDDGNA